PLPRGGGFQFEDKIFGGSVPQQFRPAIEKGIVEAASGGAIAGYPMVDFKAILVDGSYHTVDSDEHSFRAAGRKAFRNAVDKVKPTLLEPIMNVEVVAPVECSGDIMGDLNSRRGRVQGMRCAARIRSSKRKCRWPRCSTINPNSTPSPAHAAPITWSSHTMILCPATSRRRSSSRRERKDALERKRKSEAMARELAKRWITADEY